MEKSTQVEGLFIYWKNRTNATKYRHVCHLKSHSLIVNDGGMQFLFPLRFVQFEIYVLIYITFRRPILGEAPIINAT